MTVRKKKREQTPAERMIEQKRALLKRAEREIADIRAEAEERIQRIRRRMRVSEAIVEALEAGKLKL